MRALVVAVLVFAGCVGASARVSSAYDGLVIADNGDDSKMQTEGQSGDSGSAKMGNDNGTHTGDDQGVKPESDTDKVEQPARRNVPSSDDTNK